MYYELKKNLMQKFVNQITLNFDCIEFASVCALNINM